MRLDCTDALGRSGPVALDLKEIITSTATDVAADGVDDETGHGLISCYRAVKEVLRRKAVREGKDTSRFTGREEGDALDVKALQQRLKSSRLRIGRVQPNSQAATLGVKPGDIIVRYNDANIRNVQDLAAAMAKAAGADTDSSPVLVRCDQKNVELRFKPGSLGIIFIIEYDDPTFRF